MVSAIVLNSSNIESSLSSRDVVSLEAMMSNIDVSIVVRSCTWCLRSLNTSSVALRAMDFALTWLYRG
jgi:hypothetical protein